MKYSASFKLQVVKFASDNSNNSAANRKFGIDEKLVRDWRRKIDNIKSLPKTKCADRGRKCQWPELEKKVVEWVEENRKEWARHDKKSDLFARQKNHTTNEYRQFPRLKWVLHSVHEAEQTRKKTITLGGQLRAASLLTVCQWVKESWQELSKEMVECSFKKFGISNALDRTEDDLVWEEEEDSSQVEEEPDCDVYDDRITPEQWQELFGESDDEEEFHGF